MQRKTFFRYRPRIVTLMVCAAVAAMVALSNLTYDEVQHEFGDVGNFTSKSFGWPLVWHRYVGCYLWTPPDHEYVRGNIGWYWSPIRLAVNVGLWLAMVAAPAAATEWLLRRYRPRLQWSLRTMLFAIALAGVFLAWLAAVSERASLEHAIFSQGTQGNFSGPMKHRWGPKWLNLVGADDYRCWAYFARLKLKAGEDIDLMRLALVKRLPKLRHLTVDVDRLTPDIANTLSDLRHLKSLAVIENDQLDEADVRASPVALAALGKMTWIEHLHIEEPTHCGERLAQLAALTNLKSLRLDGIRGNRATDIDPCLKAIGKLHQLEFLDLHWMQPGDEGLRFLSGLTRLKWLCLHNIRLRKPSILEDLPSLPRLETVIVADAEFGDGALCRLATFPRLKAVHLDGTQVSPAGLAELARRSRIEELTLNNELVRAKGLESLSGFHQLEALHLWRNEFSGGTTWARFADNWENVPLDGGGYVKVLAEDFDRCDRALRALKEARPGVVIDGNISALWKLRENQRRPKPTEFYGNGWTDKRWMPAGIEPPISAAERVLFAEAGGWANFYGAGIYDDELRELVVSFEAR